MRHPRKPEPHFEPPSLYGGARRSRVTIMATKYICEPLLLQHGEGFAQSVNEIGSRCKRKKARLVSTQHVPPIPIGPWQPRALAGGQGLLRNGIETQPRGKHEPFLRTRDGDVHFPFVVAIIHGS